MTDLPEEDSVSRWTGYLPAVVGGLVGSLVGGIGAALISPILYDLPAPYIFLVMSILAVIFPLTPWGSLLFVVGALGSGVAVRLGRAQAALETAIATGPMLWLSSMIVVWLSRDSLERLFGSADPPSVRYWEMSFGPKWAIVTVVALVAGRRLGVAWHRRRVHRSAGNV